MAPSIMVSLILLSSILPLTQSSCSLMFSSLLLLLLNSLSAPPPCTLNFLRRSCPFPLYQETLYVSLMSSLFPSFSGGVDCRLVILCSMSNIHIWVSTYHVCLSVTGLPHSGWFLLVPYICLRISRVRFFLLSSTPLCKCTTFSLSILQLRCI